MKEQEYEDATRLLERYYADIERVIDKPTHYSDGIESRVAALMKHLEKNKSIVSALFTSLLKKCITPKQDIRLHRTDFDSGYSARSLDTHVTAPFFKRHFPTYANKESSFLTLATRERIEWTLREGQMLKIRNKELKQTFLEILNDAQTQRGKADEYLNCLIQAMILRSKDEEQIFTSFITTQDSVGSVSIYRITEMLKEHFSMPYSSRLPVIALQTSYQLLLPANIRYKGKRLESLKSHTSSDRKGFGDIEIFDKNGKPFEVVEVKHNIPLDRYIIADIVKKARNTSIQRYYALTTNEPNFSSPEEEKFVQDFVVNIKHQSGLEIIPNGIIPSLKYYLRFVEDYAEFLHQYAQNLVADAKMSTEITPKHLQEWQKICVKFHILSTP